MFKSKIILGLMLVAALAGCKGTPVAPALPASPSPGPVPLLTLVPTATISPIPLPLPVPVATTIPLPGVKRLQVGAKGWLAYTQAGRLTLRHIISGEVHYAPVEPVWDEFWWSPTGERVLYTTAGQSHTFHLLNLADWTNTSLPTELPDGQAIWGWFNDWRPDGQQILFSDQAQKSLIWRYDVIARQAKAVTQTVVTARGIWLDNRRALVEGHCGPGCSIETVVDAESGQTLRVFPALQSQGGWTVSPDRQHLLNAGFAGVLSLLDLSSGQGTVLWQFPPAVQTSAHGSYIMLYGQIPEDSDSQFYPWSPNGHYVAFVQTLNVDGADWQKRRDNLTLLEVDRPEYSLIISETIDYRWSPDSRQVIGLCRTKSVTRLYLVALNTWNGTILQDVQGHVDEAVWSPDSQRTALSVWDGQDAGLWVFNMADQTARRLTSNSNVYDQLQWIDNNRLVVRQAERNGNQLKGLAALIFSLSTP